MQHQQQSKSTVDMTGTNTAKVVLVVQEGTKVEIVTKKRKRAAIEDLGSNTVQAPAKRLREAGKTAELFAFHFCDEVMKRLPTTGDEKAKFSRNARRFMVSFGMEEDFRWTRNERLIAAGVGFLWRIFEARANASRMGKGAEFYNGLQGLHIKHTVGSAIIAAQQRLESSTGRPLSALELYSQSFSERVLEFMLRMAPLARFIKAYMDHDSLFDSGIIVENSPTKATRSFGKKMLEHARIMNKALTA